MIPFARTQEGDRDLIELAFSKKKADERKEWLRQFKVLFTLRVELVTLLNGYLAWNVLGPPTGRDSVR